MLISELQLVTVTLLGTESVPRLSFAQQSSVLAGCRGALPDALVPQQRDCDAPMGPGLLTCRWTFFLSRCRTVSRNMYI
jgi:hypothetical protein